MILYIHHQDSILFVDFRVYIDLLHQHKSIPLQGDKVNVVSEAVWVNVRIGGSVVGIRHIAIWSNLLLTSVLWLIIRVLRASISSSWLLNVLTICCSLSFCDIESPINSVVVCWT